MRLNLTLFSILLSLSLLAETTYYVDASSGNDSNNGTSPSTAWQTIERVNDATFIAGDEILFKKGETWYGEQLEVANYSGTENSVITFGAYPTDGNTNPIITSMISHSHSWTNEGGNIWKATNPPSYHPERILVNGTEMLRANMLSEIDGVNFFWLYDAEENGDLYIHSTSDPSNNEITYTAENIPLYLEDAHHIVFTNLNLQGGWTSVFVNSNTSYIRFNKMDIGQYASTGININNGEEAITPQHIRISNSTFEALFDFDYSMSEIYDENWNRGVSDAIYVQAAAYCEIDSNLFNNWGHASINIDGEPDDNGVKASFISIHNNLLTSPDICYGGRLAVDNAHDCQAYNNLIINTSIQTQLNGYNCHYHHNIIDGTTNSPLILNSDEIDAGIDVSAYSETDVENNIYEHNLIKNTEGVGFQIATNGSHNIHDNIFQNNILYNCGTVAEVENIGIWVQEDSETMIFQNTFQNNLIYNEASNGTINFRGAIMDVTEFNGLSGTDNFVVSDNLSGNPLFIDLDNNDYNVLSTSPCIDAGHNSTTTQDLQGNAIPYPSTLTDIGVYEYQGSVSILELKKNTAFVVSPNPTTGIVNLDYHLNGSYSIYSMTGSVVLTGMINDRSLDLSTLDTGVYYIQILNAKTNVYQVGQIVKE